MKVEDLRRQKWITELVMEGAATIGRRFTAEQVCKYVADKLNIEPEKVRSRVMLALKRGRNEGSLILKGHLYSLQCPLADDIADLDIGFREAKCGKKKKEDPMGCFKKPKKKKQCKKKKPKCPKKKPKCAKKKPKCPKKKKPKCPKKKKKPKCPKKKKKPCKKPKKPCSNISIETTQKPENPTTRPPSPDGQNNNSLSQCENVFSNQES